MTNHEANLQKAEQLRKENDVYIWVYPDDFTEGSTTFNWEVMAKNGSSDFYNGKKPVLKTYEEGLQSALDFYEADKAMWDNAKSI